MLTTERAERDNANARIDSKKKSAKKISVTAVQGGCVYCAYEVGGRGRGSTIPVVKRATLLFPTDKGLRALCASHAKAGAWRS